MNNAEELKLSNILNNDLAIQGIKQYYGFDNIYFTNQQIADFYEVDVRTIKRIIEDNLEELQRNDLQILKGQELKAFMELSNGYFVRDINVPHIVNLTVSTFRTVLNFAMLLKRSGKAAKVRTKILDITMQVLQDKTKGNTKFINQRDIDFLPSSYRAEVEAKKLTNALYRFVDMEQHKYPFFRNQIYQVIFKENGQQYRQILNLHKNEKIRDTMYSEILLVIASFESGFAYEIEKKYAEYGRKLTKEESLVVLEDLAKHPSQQPYIENARTKMASWDFDFRDAYHVNIAEYIGNVTPDEYSRFLGEKSEDIQVQIANHLAVFERLKDK